MGGWTQWVHSLWHSLPAHWFCQPFLATAVNINSECLLRFVLATIYENWSLCFIILAPVPVGEEGERREGNGTIACHRMRWNSFAFFSSNCFFFYCCLLVSSLLQYFMQNRRLHFPSPPCPLPPLPSVIQWANLRCKLPTSLDLAPGRSCDFSCSLLFLLQVAASPRPTLIPFLPCFHFIFVRSAPPPCHASSPSFAQLLSLLMWLISTLPLRFGHLLFQFACRFYAHFFPPPPTVHTLREKRLSFAMIWTQFKCELAGNPFRAELFVDLCSVSYFTICMVWLTEREQSFLCYDWLDELKIRSTSCFMLFS